MDINFNKTKERTRPMKKTKLLSLTLTLALVFTTVFAGTESIFAGTTVSALGSTVTALEDDGTVTAVNANSGETAKSWSVSYSSASPFAVEVKIPKAGAFEFNIATNGYTRVALYDSMDATTPVDYTDLYAVSSSDDYDTFYVKAPSAGSYYLVFYTNSSTAVSAIFNAYYAPAGNATPTKGKTYNAASLSSTKYYYYKVTTTKTGYLTISFPWGTNGNSSSYSVKLMNSSKKTNLFKGVNTVDYNKDYVTYAGVPKGTYYVAVKTTDTMYGINIKATYPTENSGSTRAKAKSISKGGTKKGIITATQSSSSADWYKIKVNSNQTVNLAITTKTGGYSGGLRFSVYSGSKTKAFGTAEFYYGDPSSTVNLFTTVNGVKKTYLQKGTYYIKVTKYGSGSGYYTLQWK